MLPDLGRRSLCWDLDGLLAEEAALLASRRDGGRGKAGAGGSLGNINLTSF